MKNLNVFARLVALSVLAFTSIVSLSGTSAASIGNITKADLTGFWQMTFFGQTGCGIGASLVTFTLNNAGTGTATETGHNSGCPDGTIAGVFNVLTLNPDGSGTAGLSCGSGCGWNLNIQVSPDRSTFSVIDVSSANPGNFVAGVAINNSTAAKVTKTNLTGKWQLALYGNTGCGVGSSLVTFTLNAAGVATNATNTRHTAGCGDAVSTLNNFTVSTLNPNGSGVAALTSR